VKSGLANVGFEATKFFSHSFRQGAASSAAAKGFNDYEIQELGRWHSNSYKLYVDSLQAWLLSLSSCLHWAVTHGQLFEPLALHFMSSVA